MKENWNKHPLAKMAMNLTLNRINLKDTFTEGLLYINGVYFCDTLEDKTRDLNKDGDLNDPGEEKVYGETSIPYGEYEVKLTFSPKFNRTMPEVKAVIGFTGIRIHSGNSAKDSSGCILVGEKVNDGYITNSRATYERLINLMTVHAGKETIKLKVI